MKRAQSIVIQRHGGPEVLTLQERELKPLQSHEALIRIATVGVNFVDVYWRSGFDPQALPFVPGLEAACVVEAIGAGVARVRPGDRVAFARQPGTYAEACVVPADCLIPLPEDFSFEQGAAFPLQGLTAHYLIHEFRKPEAGDVVLVHAAAGGVGLLLVQWARHLGAHVIGCVSSAEKAEAARRSGAQDVIVYTEQDFVARTLALTGGHGADLIFDGVGRTTFSGNLQAAAIRGHIVVFGAASGPAAPISPNQLMGRSLTLAGGDLRHFIQTRADLLRRASEVIEGLRAGWLRQHICRVFPLADAAKAHEALEGRQTIGKVLLSVA